MFMQGAGRAAHTYDAIVVGSGISGGWAAKELAEKGMRTLVLERRLDVTGLVDRQFIPEHIEAARIEAPAPSQPAQ